MDAGVYYVTGGLGSGKSSACVAKIKEALEQGRRVATNLDLNLEKLVGPWAKQTDVLRVPDHPTIDDLNFIGEGYADADSRNYDESRFGLLVLDELGTWFNSREWNKPGRREVVNWLLHARKRRWILLLIIQDLDLLDSQARAATAKDFVVYCQNLSKYSVPVLNPLWKLLTGRRLALPSIHLAVVKNGFSVGALTSDRWVYSTAPLRDAYNTRQLFIDRDAHESTGLATMLTPWLVAGRYTIKKDWGYYMAEMRKRAEIGVIAGLTGLCVAFSSAGLALGLGLRSGPVQAATVQSPSLVSSVVVAPVPEPKLARKDCSEIKAHFAQWRVSGDYGDRSWPIYLLHDGANTIRSYQLERDGYVVTPRGSCAVEVEQDGCKTYLYCGARASVPAPVQRAESGGGRQEKPATVAVASGEGRVGQSNGKP